MPIPAIYAASELTADGGLASYGHSMLDAFRRAGVYTGWILQGAIAAVPTGLAVYPVRASHQPQDRRERSCLDVPPNLLAGADQVIR